MIRARPIILLLLLSVLVPSWLSAQSGAAGGPASWVGKYSGSNLQLEIKQSTPAVLSGVITFDGKRYNATAIGTGNKLAGTFKAGNDSFPYEATRNGNELRFVTGGTEYRLQRESPPVPAAVNPLARGNSPAQSSPAPAPASGELVHVSAGFSFRLPTDWTSNETAEGVVILPAGLTFNPNAEDNPEVYLLALRNDYDPAEESQVVQQLSAAFAQNGGGGGQRQASKFGPRPGSSYRWEVRDPDSGRMTAFDIHLAAEGKRVFIMVAAGEKARVRGNDASVRQILSSLAVGAPKNDTAVSRKSAAAGPLADSTPLAQRWLNKLRGKMVRQFWASQGMSSDKRHWLNADGTYEYRSSSMVSVDVSGASGLSTGRDDSTGRWTVRDVAGEVFLEVRYNNGNVRRMPITEDNRNWYLNGEKAFAVNPE
jgi:hypothetical protein